MAKRAKKKSSTRRPKRGAKKRSSKKSLSIWIVGTVVLALALLLLGLWMGRERRPQVPLYEEITGNGFANLVAEVELVIYQSLRELRVHESQVQFGKVIHRAQRDKQWDFTELRVSLRLVQLNIRFHEDPFTADPVAASTADEAPPFLKVRNNRLERCVILDQRPWDGDLLVREDAHRLKKHSVCGRIRSQSLAVHTPDALVATDRGEMTLEVGCCGVLFLLGQKRPRFVNDMNGLMPAFLPVLTPLKHRS